MSHALKLSSMELTRRSNSLCKILWSPSASAWGLHILRRNPPQIRRTSPPELWRASPWLFTQPGNLPPNFLTTEVFGAGETAVSRVQRMDGQSFAIPQFLPWAKMSYLFQTVNFKSFRGLSTNIMFFSSSVISIASIAFIVCR
jgi:hypothetical protein